MIRALRETDRQAAVALLNRAPAFNLYMLGNLETLGFAHDFCEFWADVDEAGMLTGIINRYMSGWSVFGLAHCNWAALMAVMETHPEEATRLQDNPGGVESVMPFLTHYQATEIHVEELMDLAAEDFRPAATPPGMTIRRATLDDLPALVEIYQDAGHMSRSVAGIERPLRDTRLWLAEDATGVIRSAALTNAETQGLAMIGGVFTPPQWRGQGLSQAVCGALCGDLLAAGKRPVLYWDTPAAGAVYRKLGFQERGHWTSVWLSNRID